MTSSTTRGHRNALRRTGADSRRYDLVIERTATFGNSRREIPSRITMLCLDPRLPGDDQLFLDQVPISRDAWSYDPHDQVLSWKGAFGGGQLWLSRDGRGGQGNVGPAHDICSVTAAVTAQFVCDVALHCGAGYVSSGGSITGFTWDPESPEWKSAEWIPNRLQLTYTATVVSPIEPPSLTFDFQDNGTGEEWDAGSGDESSIAPGHQDGTMVWNLSFQTSFVPGNTEQAGPVGPDTVFPYWFQAVEDPLALSINGVLQIDDVAPQGTLVGVRGVQTAPVVAGYYQTAGHAAPFGVFDGKLVIGGAPVPGTALIDDMLRWSDLDPAYQRRTGLPASGSMRFDSDGLGAAVEGTSVQADRLSTTAALTAIARHSDLHPEVHRKSVDHAEALDTTTLDIYSLLAMTPYVQDATGDWTDVVQEAVTGDLGDIMNSFIPPAMWKLLFPTAQLPELTDELAAVAGSPVPGVTDPAQWYRSLATAVLTYGMSKGSDENCRYLNGPRAMAWLTSEVAKSKVYYAHGQQLFQRQWQKRFPLTSEYLAAEITNAAQYAALIAAKVQDAVTDINTNVADSPSFPDLKAKLIEDVRNAGDYATTNNLFWAFAFHTYNVSSTILARIAQQMSNSTGSSDGNSLSRTLQQNVTVLTALDPSGFFAKRYVSTVNTFLATNILPSMFGFLGDAMDFSIIKEYLTEFSNDNIGNADEKIAEAAKKIAGLLAEENADRVLRDSIEVLRQISAVTRDLFALPYIANKWATKFAAAYPALAPIADLFGAVLISGITGLAVYNLITVFKKWDEVSDTEKASLFLDTAQLSLQIMAAVVTRGIRIYAIFGVGGMTVAMRSAAIARIVFTGEAGKLDMGLVKIGSSFARWLGDVEGTVGKLATSNSGALTAVLVTETAVGARQVSWASRIFGKNLEEFVGSRMGALLIVAGMTISVVRLAEGESGIARTADIINIVGGSLMLVSMIPLGRFAAILVGRALSAAGPLSIVLALAGLGLLLYELLKDQPDPVAEFIDEYVKPAGFWIGEQASSVDYAIPYRNPDQDGLMMIGFRLTTADWTLCANPDGSLQLGPPTMSPDCVWRASTDGFGRTTILTVAQPDDTKPPVLLYLSMLSDDSVSFQPRMQPSQPSSGDGPVVVTQTWLGVPQGKATLTSDGANMATLDLRIQAVLPDADGDFDPGQPFSWLTHAGTGLVMTIESMTTFTLTMSGMAPNYMTMADLEFLQGSKPSADQSFGPVFGVFPSAPISFACQGDPLPDFLTFDAQTGSFSPNGGQASTAFRTTNTITAKNPCGDAAASFSTTIAAPPAPPSQAD